MTSQNWKIILRVRLSLVITYILQQNPFRQMALLMSGQEKNMKAHTKTSPSRVHTYLIMNWVNGMRIWRAVRGEGSELGSSSRARVLPSPRERGPSSALARTQKLPLPPAGV